MKTHNNEVNVIFTLGRCMAGCLLFLSLPAAVFAQEANDQAASAKNSLVLEEVIVTAQKREQSLREVPISLVVIGGETIAENGLLELEDLSAQVPGFTVTEAAVGSQVFVRGLGSGINQGFEQSVGMYIDGIYAGRGRQYRSGFLDVERVELLRGPQGILFGKNTIAGAINITTRQPTRDFGGYLSLRTDFDHGERALDAAITGPLSERVSGRLAVRGGAFDGWMFNSFNGRDETSVDDLMLRGSLLWSVTDETELTFKVEHSAYDTKGRNIQITQAGPYTPFYQFWDPAFEDDFDELKSTGGIGRDASSTDNTNAALTLKHDAENFTLTAITGWMSYDYTDELDVDFGPIPNLFQTDVQTFDQFSQELRLASSLGDRFEYQVGVYTEFSGLENGKSLDADLTTIGVPLPPVTRQSSFKQDGDSWAVFGQATWFLSDALRVNAGLRYTRESKSAVQRLWFTDFRSRVPNPVLGSFYAAAGFGVPHDYDQSQSDGEWSPLLSLQWDSSETVSWYGSFAQGFKAGGFNESEVSGDPAAFAFGPEHSSTLEAGVKMRLLDGAARLDMALFHTEFEDLQVSTFQGVNFVVGNAARATSKGFELEGDWLLSETLSVRGSWTWLDSSYDEFADAACTSDQTLASGSGVCVQDLAGRPTLFAPKNAAFLALTWQTRSAAGHGWLLEGSITHSDGFYLEQDLDREAYQSAYQKFGFRAAWMSPDDRWTVALLGRNLNDELTSHHGSDVPLLAGAHYKATDRPRSIALQLSRQF